MRKIARAVISMGLVFALSGCSWQVPQTITVKSNAEYNFALGTFEKELGNDLDISKMIGDIENEQIKIYDYFPGKKDKNVQHFMVEVEVLDLDILAQLPQLKTVMNLLPEGASVDLTDASIAPYTALPVALDDKTYVDFNPATMLKSMKDALNYDIAGKVEFKSVPMYIYCEAVEGLEVATTVKMYYTDKSDPPVKRTAVPDFSILTGSLVNTPRPEYRTDPESKAVITDLSTVPCLGGKKELTTIINNNDASIQSDDQLCIEYSITGITGTITKPTADEGLHIKMYAVIDIPVEFATTERIDMNLDEITGSGSSSSSSSSSSSKSDKDEFSKYLDAVDSITIRYAAYQLPVFSKTGMNLGIDLVGDGSMEYVPIAVVDKTPNAKKTEKKLGVESIKKMKQLSSLSPKFNLIIAKDTTISLPREKGVEMDLELSLKTDGPIKVK